MLLKSKKSRSRRALAIVATAAMSLGIVGGTASVAFAANPNSGTSWYCNVYSYTPYLSSTKITGRGSADGCSGATYKFYVQLHRSEGWWHPLVAQKTSGPAGYTSWGSLYPSNCDPDGSHVYFTQTFMQDSGGVNGGALASENSSSLNPCDSA